MEGRTFFFNSYVLWHLEKVLVTSEPSGSISFRYI